MNVNNEEFIEFCKDKIGTPYVMGTNGKIFTESMYNDLVKRNPANWFKNARLPQVKKWIGQRTTDCHGLIEWFIREATGKSYDVTADSAFNSATEKGEISSIPEIQGICVRYFGHVGVYIGNGKVIEARGFDYGTCITELSKRPWTHWYKHSQIEYKQSVKRFCITKNMNTEEIQSVLDKGGYILFEKATYNITKPLIVKSNTELNLNGAILRQSAKLNHIMLTDTMPNTTGYNGACNIVIQNGTFEGMGKYNNCLNLLTLYHAQNVIIANVIFQDVVGHHHLEINSSQNVSVDKCRFMGYNVIDKNNDYRECIQIDSAVESALVIHALGSKCYDKTTCKNISIKDCYFGKSNSRPAPSACIGNHCQVNDAYHDNIVISGNVFVGGTQNNPNATCVNIVGMNNVKISNNSVTKYGRAVRIYSYGQSYDESGNKGNALKNDGRCTNVIICDNNIGNPIGLNAVNGIWSASNKARHGAVTMTGNLLDNNIKCKLNYCDGGYVTDNCEIGKTCLGVYTKKEESN